MLFSILPIQDARSMMSFFKKPVYPEFYQQYLELIEDQGYSARIIALDVEASGMNPKHADILSLGAVEICENRIETRDSIHVFFHSEQNSRDSIVIHELLPHVSDDLFLDFIPDLLKIIGNKKILGHYVEFDVAMINAQMKKLGLPGLKNPILDTLQIALKKDGIHDLRFARKGDYTLYKLCDRYNIEIETVHDALEDAYLSALLYLKMR